MFANCIVLFNLNILYLLQHPIVTGMKFWIHGMYYVICASASACVHVHTQMIMPMYTQPFKYHPLHAPTEHNSISVASSVVNSLQTPVFDCILSSNIQINFPFQVSLEVHQPT